MKPQVAYGENNVHYQFISLSISCWSKEPVLIGFAHSPSPVGLLCLRPDQPSLIRQTWLTGWWIQPLWKIWKSVGMIIPNIWKNKSHVPNHQPVKTCLKPTFIPWIPPEFPREFPICLDPWESRPVASMDPLPPFRTVPHCA